jgi:hypothetical protein
LKYQNYKTFRTTTPITPTQSPQPSTTKEHQIERGERAKNSKYRNKFKILKKTKETNVEQKFMN